MSEATLPEGWSLKRLDELARVTSGKRIPKGRRLSTAQTDHPYIRVTDMFMGGVDATGIQYVPDEVFSEISQFTVASGDIFISCAGTLGLVGIVPESLNGANLTENANRIWSIQCDRRFLLSVLMSDRIQSVIQNIQTVGAQPKLALGRIRSFDIPCPNKIEEQQAIAAALSDADGVVAGLERVIAKKRLIKQGAMQDLLTARRRLPGFSGEWEVKRLGELVTIVMGQSPSSNAYNSQGDGLPLIQGNADIKDRMTITRVFTREVTKLGKAGDYLMTVRAPVGEIATTEMDVCLGRGVCALRTDERIVYHIMVAKEPEWAKLSKGSTFDSVNGAEIRSFEVLYPTDAEERVAVAQVLDDMDAEIQTLESRLTKARAVKEGMMQNLLTGRVRLI